MGNKKVVWIIAVWVLISPLAIGEEFDSTKALVMGMEFNEGVLYQDNTAIVYNHPPVYKVKPSQGLMIDVYSTDGDKSGEFPYHDPRRSYSSVGGFQYLDDVSFDIIMPFVQGMGTVRILDSNGTELIEIDVSDSVREFCMETNDYCDSDCGESDPDCGLGTTTVGVTTVPTTLPTTIPTTVPTTTTEQQEGGGLEGYLPYLAGVIVLAVIAVIVLRSKQLKKMEQKRKKEEEDLSFWVEGRLRSGEDPELLKKALERQGASPAVVDEIMKKL